MSDSLYIDDGFTLTKTIPAEPGLHPELAVEYRPALFAERRAYQTEYAGVQATGDPKRAEAFARREIESLVKHVVKLNGEPLSKDRAVKLRPVIAGKLLDLVFSYAPADEAADAKN